MKFRTVASPACKESRAELYSPARNSLYESVSGADNQTQYCISKTPPRHPAHSETKNKKMTATPGPLFALALASISLIGPLAVHLFLPVIPAVKAALGLSDAIAQLTFSVALFGMAFATLFYGSLSDRYGRRPVLLSGLCLFLVGSARYRRRRRRCWRWCWAGWCRRSARAAASGSAVQSRRTSTAPRAWSRRSPISPCSIPSAR